MYIQLHYWLVFAPPPCDGWLGRSAFALTKRTCSDACLTRTFRWDPASQGSCVCVCVFVFMCVFHLPGHPVRLCPCIYMYSVYCAVLAGCRMEFTSARSRRSWGGTRSENSGVSTASATTTTKKVPSTSVSVLKGMRLMFGLRFWFSHHRS